MNGGEPEKEFTCIYDHDVDLLWSDPEAQVDSWAISPRGGGFLFGHLPTNAVSLYTSDMDLHGAE